MINKKRKFEESYMQYGFNSILFSNKERPECLLCICLFLLPFAFRYTLLSFYLKKIKLIVFFPLSFLKKINVQ